MQIWHLIALIICLPPVYGLVGCIMAGVITAKFMNKELTDVKFGKTPFIDFCVKHLVIVSWPLLLPVVVVTVLGAEVIKRLNQPKETQ